MSVCSSIVKLPPFAAFVSPDFLAKFCEHPLNDSLRGIVSLYEPHPLPFLRSVLIQRLVVSTVTRHWEPPKPISLSEIQDEENKAPAYLEFEKENEGNRRVGDTQPTDYDDYIDAEGFDGGDGQV